MSIDKPLRITLALAISAVALAACDRDTQHTTGQKLDHAMERTKEDLARAGEKVKPTLEKAGDEIKHAGEQIKPTLDKAGEKIAEASRSDIAITTSIKADYLKDPDLSVFKIDVDTKDGVVVLKGYRHRRSLRAE